MDVYRELGVRRVVPAVGPPTVYGGTVMSEEIWRAMRESGRYFVSMAELYAKAGERIAKLVGAEAAYPAPGTAAAMHVAAALCIAEGDPEKMMQLPDTTGLKTEFIIEQRQRSYWGGPYYFEKAIEVAGGRLIPVGTETRTEPEEIETAVNERTAAIHFQVMSHNSPSGEEGLEDALRVGKKHGVPVIVDAASRVLPRSSIGKYNRMGADLVCYGGKYIGGPSASGYVCGRKALMRGLAGVNAWRWPHARGLKMERWLIVALVKALEIYMRADIDARERRLNGRAKALARRLNAIPGIKAEFVETPFYGSLPVLAPQVKVNFEDKKLTVEHVTAALAKNDPPVFVENISIRVDEDGSIVDLPAEERSVLVMPRTFLPDEADIVVRAFRRLVRS